MILSIIFTAGCDYCPWHLISYHWVAKEPASALAHAAGLQDPELQGYQTGEKEAHACWMLVKYVEHLSWFRGD